MAESDFLKASGVRKDFFINWRERLVKAWGPDRRFDVGDIVRAPTETGWVYKIVASGDVGRSGAIQPAWSIVDTATFIDGSLTWTVFHPDASGLFTIDTSAWTVDAGITEVEDQIVGLLTRLRLDDGVDGSQYLCVNDIVTSDGVEAQESFIVGIEDAEPV